MRLLRRRRQRTTCLAFSPDGRRLAVGGRSGPKAAGRVDVWEVPAGEAPVTLPALSVPTWELAFTAEGGLAVQVGDEVRLYGGPSFRDFVVACRWKHRYYVGASFSPDGRRLALDDGEAVRLIDLRPPFAEVWRQPLSRDHDLPSRPAFSPDGRRLAVEAPNAVEVRDADTGVPVTSLAKADEVWSEFRLLWSPDGRWVCEHWSQWARVWDVATGRQVFQQEVAVARGEWVGGAAFHPSGRLAVSSAGRSGGVVRLFSPGDWREEAVYSWPCGRVSCLAFSPDGTLGAAGGDKPEVVLWDVDL